MVSAIFWIWKWRERYSVVHLRSHSSKPTLHGLAPVLGMPHFFKHVPDSYEESTVIRSRDRGDTWGWAIEEPWIYMSVLASHILRALWCLDARESQEHYLGSVTHVQHCLGLDSITLGCCFYTPHSVELLRGKKFLEETCLLIVAEETSWPNP